MSETEIKDVIRKEYNTNLYSPENLARRVLELYFESTPQFPINIFKMLKEFGVFYKFDDLDRLEGVYLPEDDDSPAVAAINIKRPFTRQRFTAAHELAHHLKDYSLESYCPLNSKSPLEQYADKFASELLMPRSYFLEVVETLKSPEGYVSAEDAFYLCHYFGTSYTSVIWKLKYLRLLNFTPSKSFFKKAKAQQKLSTCPNDTVLIEQIINSYTYFPVDNTNYMWQKFINEFAFEDSRLEGIEIEQSEVSEMLTDFKLYGNKSIFYQRLASNRYFEVFGHSFMYSYIKNSRISPSRKEILELHRQLFYLAPTEMDLGVFRKNNNRIAGAKIETARYEDIEQLVHLLVGDIDELINVKDHLTISEYLKKAVFIHHEITKIHPFEDGNGRISRAVMNWLLKIKGLPPVYVSYTNKEDYYDALSLADNYNNSELNLYFMNKLLSSFSELNFVLSALASEN